MSSFEVYHRILATEAQERRVRSRLVGEYKLQSSCGTGVRFRRTTLSPVSPSLKAVKLGLILASTDLFGTKAEQNLISLHGLHVAFFHARIDSAEPIPVRRRRKIAQAYGRHKEAPKGPGPSVLDKARPPG